MSTARRFPKSARLLTPRDYKIRPFRRYETDCFLFVFTGNGSGRLGVSLSKKVLRRAVWRNRVRRLLREAFRLTRDRLRQVDVHVVGLSELSERHGELGRKDLDQLFDELAKRTGSSAS